MHKKMSYRRYERLLLTKRYTSDEATNAGDTARSVSFQEDVTEIPKSPTPEKSPTKSIENGSGLETKSVPTSTSAVTSNSNSTSFSSSSTAQLAQSLSSTKSRSYSSYSSSLSSSLSNSNSSSSSSRTSKLKSESSASSSNSSTYVSYTSRFRESVAASAAASEAAAKSLTSLRETQESKAKTSLQSFSTEKTQQLSLSSASSSSMVNGLKSSDSLTNGSNGNDSSSLLNETLSPTLKAYYRPKEEESTKGKYVNWSTQHAILADQPWCCIGDLMSLCDKYEFKTIALHDTRTHNAIIAEVTALLRNGNAPFDMRKRFPGNIHEPENLWVCIGRCAGVEYHLKRIVSTFRKPLDKLQPDKQRVARQNFHLSINELRLDISARISEVRLYDRNVFEKDFNLKWEDNVED